MDPTADLPTGRDLWFLGTLIRLRATAADTGGRLAVFEQCAHLGFSPPLHVHHREDTALFVLEGEIVVQVGDEQSVVGPGGFAWLPRDVPHTFRVDTDECRLLELVTPAGFEHFHVDAGDPAETLDVPGPGEPDIPRLLAAIAPYGAEIIGPPLAGAGALSPRPPDAGRA